MKVSLSTEAGAGQWHGMHQAVLLWVSALPLAQRGNKTLNLSYAVQLFGASAFTKDVVLGIQDYSKATWTQNFIASVAGAVTSITVAAPLDVVKTRIQNANFEQNVKGGTVIKELI